MKKKIEVQNILRTQTTVNLARNLSAYGRIRVLLIWILKGTVPFPN